MTTTTRRQRNGPAGDTTPARGRRNCGTTKGTDNTAPIVTPGVVDLDDVRPAALDAWRKACAYMRERGVAPLPPEHVIRALRRRGWWPR